MTYFAFGAVIISLSHPHFAKYASTIPHWSLDIDQSYLMAHIRGYELIEYEEKVVSTHDFFGGTVID